MARMVRSPWMVLVAIVTASATILAARTISANRLEQANQPPELVAQPPTWQAFTAELMQSNAGAPDFVGHYYRASDGSDRYDMATRDGGVHAATIVSVSTGWQYMCNMIKNRCERRALTGRERPIALWRVDTRGLVKTAQQLEGYLLYEYTDARGVKNLLAPALNFAPLVRDDPQHGLHRTMFNIQLGEPSPLLFEPPRGAEIVDPQPHQQH